MKKHNSWGRVLEHLTTPMTNHQLASFVHLHQRTVGRILRDMHKEGLVHVVDWVHLSPPGPFTAVYAYGPGKSAPHPRPLTSVETSRRLRARMTLSERESMLQRRRIARPDIAASWIK